MELNSFVIKKRLMIASAYAAYKGGLVLDKRKKGINCDAENHRLDVLLSLIDSLYRYATIYVNPSYNGFSTVSLGYAVGSTIQITINNDVVLGPYTLASSTYILARQEIADFINADNKGFTAEVSGAGYIILTANSGSLANEWPIAFVVTGGLTLDIVIPQEFSDDGEDYFSRYSTRCLEDNEIWTILDRINEFIDVPCEKFINF